jgi:hypothetical protein
MVPHLEGLSNGGALPLGTHAEADRTRFSNSSLLPSACEYAGFLIFTQLVSSGVYSLSFRLATIPSRSNAHTRRNNSTPRASM